MTTDHQALAARWAPTLGNTPRLHVVPESAGDSAPTPGEVGRRTGAMIGFFLPEDQARELAVDGGEDAGELHLTVAFITRDVTDLPDGALKTLQAVVARWAAATAPMDAEVSGLGMFTSGREIPVTYASTDAPGLAPARDALMKQLFDTDVYVPNERAFTPHITLAYDDKRSVKLPELSLRFDTVTLAWAGKRYEYPLTGGQQKARLQLAERVPEPAAAVDEPVRAFVTESNGRTLITAPASTMAFMRESAVMAASANKNFLWMQGRFVGAEEPNRNNAFWTAGDLELGNATVVNGPLNWLHEGRHIIGTIADATYVGPSPLEQAAETANPHIVATSAIWRWLYPDEAWVVEQASDAGKLWYSMECISESVRCREDGCGSEVAYGAYLNDMGCSHMTQRAGVRHFANPTFLGGAVIIPPARPGWADADAAVVQQAVAHSEKAFDQAGHPDMSASEWEQLMAQVLTYANG